MTAGRSGLVRLVDGLRAAQRAEWRAGRRQTAEILFELYPDLLDEPQCALELVYNEVVLREEIGEAPRLDEYLQRFPKLAAHLPPIFEVHSVLQSEHLKEVMESWPLGGLDLPAVDEGESGWPDVPGYRILEELGRGGMGVVYKAIQLHLNRVVALKVIRGGSFATAEHLARFRAEAEAAARLQHPNIVQVYEVGESSGVPYFSLEFVAGGTLAEQLNGSPLAARHAAELSAILARAVHYAHQRGVLHRDLKPANILLDADAEQTTEAEHSRSAVPRWNPKITDFGLAKQREVDVQQTRTGVILGTPSYMAPEQARSKPSEVGPGTDVYALGAILYELLTGRPTFKGPNAFDTLRQVIFDDPIPISRLQIGVPYDLVTICQKCLDKSPAKRYATALELALDLERYLADQPILARRSNSLEKAWRWCRRNPYVATLLTSIALLLAVIAVGASLAAFRLRRELSRSEQAEAATVANLWEAKLEQVRAIRQGHQAGRRFRALQILREAAAMRTDLRLRNEAVACFTLADLGHARILPGEGPEIEGIGFDSDLKNYALSDEAGNIVIRSVADGTPIARLPGSGVPAHILRFSPDGRFLAAKYYRPIDEAKEYRVWDWRTGKEAIRQSSDDLGVSMDFSPDGKTIALGGRKSGAVSFYRLDSGREEKRLLLGRPPHWLAFHPSGQRFAASGMDVHVYDVASGAILSTFEVEKDWISGLAWRPDGRYLAAASAKGRIYIWDTLRNQVHAELKGHQREVLEVAFNHSGNLLASNSWDGTTRLWEPDSGEELVEAEGKFSCFSPDDRRLAYIARRHAAVWDVASGSECRRLHTRPLGGLGPWAMDFTSDGRILVAAGRDGIRLWDTTKIQEIAHLSLQRTYSVFFDPPGERLIASCPDGIYEWSFRADLANRTMIRIGAPMLLSASALSLERLSRDQTGQRLAVVDTRQQRGFVLDLKRPSSPILLGRHENLSSIAMTPDGKWVATGTFQGSGVKIWDTGTGQLVRTLPAHNAAVSFSPDGRWLVVGHEDEYDFYRVGSWEPAHRVQSPLTEASVAAFSPDSHVMAAIYAFRAIRLVDPPTGNTLADLVVGSPKDIIALSFSGNGSMLAAATRDQGIQLWDLRRIRQELADMDLDWDLPPYVALDRRGPDPLPLTVHQEMNAGLCAEYGDYYWKSGECGEAINQYRQSLRLDGKQSRVEGALAWAYAMSPPPLRNAAAALPLAEMAVRREPADRSHHSTLGLVYYRLGKYGQAIATLGPNTDIGSPNDLTAFDWVVLALSQAKLGQPDQARTSYFRAIATWRSQRPAANASPSRRVQEFNALREEADELLAIDQKPRSNTNKPEG